MMVLVRWLAVLRNTEKHHLPGANALIRWPGLMAPVLGPPLGGFITRYASWYWIFLLNLPLGTLALVFAWRLMPQALLFKENRLPFDWVGVGFVYCALGCGALVYGLEQISQRPAAPASYLWLAGSAVTLWVVGRHLWVTLAPLLRPGVLETPTYAVTVHRGFQASVTDCRPVST